MMAGKARSCRFRSSIWSLIKRVAETPIARSVAAVNAWGDMHVPPQKRGFVFDMPLCAGRRSERGCPSTFPLWTSKRSFRRLACTAMAQPPKPRLRLIAKSRGRGMSGVIAWRRVPGTTSSRETCSASPPCSGSSANSRKPAPAGEFSTGKFGRQSYSPSSALHDNTGVVYTVLVRTTIDPYEEHHV
jgi:hypothetical protein